MKPRDLARGAVSAGLALLAMALPAAAELAPSSPPAPAPVWRTFPAVELQIRDLAGLVHVIPEARADIALSIVNPGPLQVPRIRVSQHRLMIDGGLRRQITGCHINGAAFAVDVRGRGRLDDARLPRLELRVPQETVINANGGLRLWVGRAQSAEIAVSGCGDSDLEGVDGAANIAVAGTPYLRLYEAGSAEVRIAGQGDATLGVVRAGLTVSIAGAGDVIVARADGPTSIAVQGSGDVTIRDGRATTMSVVIAGSGDVRHGGEAQSLDVFILGSGDVRVRRVDGTVSRRVMGSGDVVIGQ